MTILTSQPAPSASPSTRRTTVITQVSYNFMIVMMDLHNNHLTGVLCHMLQYKILFVVLSTL